jgi:hypothetical protein
MTQAIIGYRYMIVRPSDLEDRDFAQMKLTSPVTCYRSWDKAYEAAFTCAYLHYNNVRLGMASPQFNTMAGDDAQTLSEKKKAQMKAHVDEGGHDLGFFIGQYGRPSFSVFISAVFAEDE